MLKKGAWLLHLIGDKAQPAASDRSMYVCIYLMIGKGQIVRHVNDLLIKYSIPLALFAAARTFADGVNAEAAHALSEYLLDNLAFKQ